jgi:preprotein translocase subunit YajC
VTPPIACLVLAADPAPAGGEGEGGGGAPGGLFGSFLPILLIFLIFYFLLIRPQSRERRKREEQLKTVRKHDRVITNAGIHGTVAALGDSYVVLEIADDVRIKVERTALWQIKARAGEEDEEAESPAGAAKEKERGTATG